MEWFERHRTYYDQKGRKTKVMPHTRQLRGDNNGLQSSSIALYCLLNGRSICRLYHQANVGHAGFSPEDFSGHSLRAGLATSAARRGQHERDIMQQTHHKGVKVLRPV